MTAEELVKLCQQEASRECDCADERHLNVLHDVLHDLPDAVRELLVGVRAEARAEALREAASVRIERKLYTPAAISKWLRERADKEEEG